MVHGGHRYYSAHLRPPTSQLLCPPPTPQLSDFIWQLHPAGLFLWHTAGYFSLDQALPCALQ